MESIEKKYSPEVQNEIDDILSFLNAWKIFFFINHEFFYDGWAFFLKEKTMYPRSIIIFKSYDNNEYSIKSFEIYLNNFKNEEFKELYAKKHIKNKENLLKEIKEVIYGKDLINQTTKKLHKLFL